MEPSAPAPTAGGGGWMNVLLLNAIRKGASDIIASLRKEAAHPLTHRGVCTK